MCLQGASKDDNWSLDWPLTLAEYIRNNDQALIEQGDTLLRTYQEDLLTSASFGEFCDVCGLLAEVNDPDAFLTATLEAL